MYLAVRVRLTKKKYPDRTIYNGAYAYLHVGLLSSHSKEQPISYRLQFQVHTGLKISILGNSYKRICLKFGSEI